MKIVKHSKIVDFVSYHLVFDFDHSAGAGFAFPCNEAGHVELLPIEAEKNLAQCRSGSVNGKPVTPMGIEKREQSYRSPGVNAHEALVEALTLAANLINEAGFQHSKFKDRAFISDALKQAGVK